MSGYTKGPWRLGALDVTPFGTGFSMGIDAESHGELATVVWQIEDDKIDGKPSLECEANARLISAAPELLEALIECLPCLGWEHDSDDEIQREHELGNGYAELIIRARAAIAKATERTK